MNPPEPVRHVLKVVLLLFGNHDESWNSMKNFVEGCVDKILNFDIQSMKSDLRSEVKAVLNSHAKILREECDLQLVGSGCAASPNELNTLEGQLDSSRKGLVSCRK
jgi:hypothetical protein